MTRSNFSVLTLSVIMLCVFTFVSIIIQIDARMKSSANKTCIIPDNSRCQEIL